VPSNIDASEENNQSHTAVLIPAKIPKDKLTPSAAPVIASTSASVNSCSIGICMPQWRYEKVTLRSLPRSHVMGMA